MHAYLIYIILAFSNVMAQVQIASALSEAFSMACGTHRRMYIENKDLRYHRHYKLAIKKQAEISKCLGKDTD